VELVMRAENANAFVENMTNSESVGKLAAQVINDKFSFIEPDDSNITRCTVYAWWENFVDELEAVRLEARCVIQHGIDHVRNWVESQVGPSLLVLIALFYTPFFLLSFLCPKHAHVLNVYFGVPGSGKTTFAAYLTKWALHENALIRFCRKHPNRLTALLLNSRYLKRRIDVYSNVLITGAYRLDAKADIGRYMIENNS